MSARPALTAGGSPARSSPVSPRSALERPRPRSREREHTPMDDRIADGSGGAYVEIPAGWVTLSGDLTVPPGARGIVLFAHGTGSGRYSPRNQTVARVLQSAQVATVLMDLLTPEEEA